MSLTTIPYGKVLPKVKTILKVDNDSLVWLTAKVNTSTKVGSKNKCLYFLKLLFEIGTHPMSKLVSLKCYLISVYPKQKKTKTKTKSTNNRINSKINQNHTLLLIGVMVAEKFCLRNRVCSLLFSRLKSVLHGKQFLAKQQREIV